MIQHLDKVLFCKLKWKVLCRFALCNMHFARIKSQRSKLLALGTRSMLSHKIAGIIVEQLIESAQFQGFFNSTLFDSLTLKIKVSESEVIKTRLIRSCWFKEKLPKLVHKSKSRLFQIKWISNIFLTKIRIFEMGNFWNLFLFTLS